MSERVLVCGGRNYDDQEYVNAVLNDIHFKSGISLLIHGGSTGADHFAHQWAIAAGVPIQVEKAEWHVFGKAAGPLRNVRMAKLLPDRVLAFAGGRGTQNMIQTARRFGLFVEELP